MNEKPWIRVAAALIELEGRYLITRRREGVHLGGLWEFPGGKCETGESFETCLQRELLEELGVEISPPQLFMTQDHEYPEKSVKLKFFFCSILRGDPKALGCAEFCWVKAEKLGDFEFPPADLPVVSRLISGMSY
jgi:mutator protein MutT